MKVRYVARVARGLAVAALPVAFAMDAGAQQSQWALTGANGPLYSMRATGLATDAAGATLTLRSDSALSSMSGSIGATIPADSFRLRRVRIVADVETKDLTGG